MAASLASEDPARGPSDGPPAISPTAAPAAPLPDVFRRVLEIDLRSGEIPRCESVDIDELRRVTREDTARLLAELRDRARASQRPHEFDATVEEICAEAPPGARPDPWEAWARLGCNTFLAPMTHCSGAAFRRLLAANVGPDVRLGFYTQMIGADALLYSEAVRRDLFASVLPGERLVLQLYGSDPWHFVLAARLLRHSPVAGSIAALDVNLGCPQACAGARGYGLFVSRCWPLVYAIVRALAEFSGFPVFAKIRLPGGGAPALRRYLALLVVAGASAVCVHGREGREGSFKAQAREADAGCLARVLGLDRAGGEECLEGGSGNPASGSGSRQSPETPGFAEPFLISPPPPGSPAPGAPASGGSPPPPSPPPGPFLVPLIYNGGIRSREAWRRQLDAGCCNAVMIGVAFLQNPALLAPGAGGDGGDGGALPRGGAKYLRPGPAQARELTAQYAALALRLRAEGRLPGFGLAEAQRHLFRLCACWDREAAQLAARARDEGELLAGVERALAQGRPAAGEPARPRRP